MSIRRKSVAIAVEFAESFHSERSSCPADRHPVSRQLFTADSRRKEIAFSRCARSLSINPFNRSPLRDFALAPPEMAGLKVRCWPIWRSLPRRRDAASASLRRQRRAVATAKHRKDDRWDLRKRDQGD